MEYSVLEIRVQGVAKDRLPILSTQIGNTLGNHIRSSDVLLRFHNGRFVVILVNITPKSAVRVVERLQLVLEALKVTTVAPDPLDFDVEITNHSSPEESQEPSVQAAVVDAMTRRGR